MRESSCIDGMSDSCFSRIMVCFFLSGHTIAFKGGLFPIFEFQFQFFVFGFETAVLLILLPGFF